MDKEEILMAVEGLAQSQGLYGRLLMELQENEALMDFLVKQNFKNVVDMIMFIEE